jgi:hypothetical protein
VIRGLKDYSGRRTACNGNNVEGYQLHFVVIIGIYYYYYSWKEANKNTRVSKMFCGRL